MAKAEYIYVADTSYTLSINVSAILYHLVCPSKYRRIVFDDEVDRVLKETCEGIELRYEIRFLEVG